MGRYDIFAFTELDNIHLSAQLSSCVMMVYWLSIEVAIMMVLLSFVPIQYEHAPLRVRCAMLCKYPPVEPVLSCLSCFRKSSVGVWQVVSNSPDPGVAWPSARFPFVHCHLIVQDEY